MTTRAWVRWGGCGSNVVRGRKRAKRLLFHLHVCGHMISWELGVYAGIFFLWIAEGYKPDSDCKITESRIHTYVKYPNCNLPQLTIHLIFNENLEAQWKEERTDIGSMSHYLQTKKKIYLREWLLFNKNQVVLRAQQFKTNQKENDFKFLTI